jgi:sarcosine oxidase subunit alpha
VKHQPNRLDLDASHALAGTAIDRTRPLRFRLNGHVIHGFAGDTVLSAAMASGVESVGTVNGAPIALDASFAPPVTPAALHRDPQQAFPMERLPAQDGLDLLTLPVGSLAGRSLRLAARLRGRSPRALGIELGRRQGLVAIWRQMPISGSERYDLAVIGGGLSGMSAALAAARAGQRVVLIERQVRLGGNALLFGRIEGEEGPAEAIARLTRDIEANGAITTMLRAEAIGMTGRDLLIHRVSDKDGAAYGEALTISADRIVLAPGSVEQLPVFPGNRLPGVSTLTNAFQLAHHYGVWPGQTAMFATTVNTAYRLAMLAADAGVKIVRIIDHRPDPRSRFIEFCKAYGITRTGGVKPVRATPARRTAGLVVESAIDMDEYSNPQPPFEVERLILCGGWAPDLALWLAAGGATTWDPARGALVAAGTLPEIALAGSAALVVGTDGCIDSGVRAVDHLLGRALTPIRATEVDPIYESPDWKSPLSGGTSDEAGPPAFLGSGLGLTQRSAAPESGRLARLNRKPIKSDWLLAERPHSLGLGELGSAVSLGLIPPTAADPVARERAPAIAPVVTGTLDPSDTAPAQLVPDYLAHRFGPGARVWEIRAEESRLLDAGSMIFVNSDATDPQQAIGVVVETGAPGIALALIDASRATPGQGATLRDLNRPVRIRLAREHREP